MTLWYHPQLPGATNMFKINMIKVSDRLFILVLGYFHFHHQLFLMKIKQLHKNMVRAVVHMTFLNVDSVLPQNN